LRSFCKHEDKLETTPEAGADGQVAFLRREWMGMKMPSGNSLIAGWLVLLVALFSASSVNARPQSSGESGPEKQLLELVNQER
jgi:hypothetical protein